MDDNQVGVAGDPKSHLTPYRTNVARDETLRWCACGLSNRQPFCDQAHRGTTFRPLLFRLPETMTVALCGCKATRNPPYCDGSHQSALATPSEGNAA